MEPACFNGDTVPYEAPGCDFYKYGIKVDTKLHGVQEYFLASLLLSTAILNYPSADDIP